MIIERLLYGPGVPQVYWFLDSAQLGGTVGAERVLCVVPHAGPQHGCGYLAIEFPDVGPGQLGAWVPRAEAQYPVLIGARRISDRSAQHNVPGLYGLVGRLLRG